MGVSSLQVLLEGSVETKGLMSFKGMGWNCTGMEEMARNCTGMEEMAPTVIPDWWWLWRTGKLQFSEPGIILSWAFSQ